MKAIAEQIWDMKYRLHGEDGTPLDLTVEDTWDRVAKALAEAETPETRQAWEARFREAMEGLSPIGSCEVACCKRSAICWRAK